MKKLLLLILLLAKLTFTVWAQCTPDNTINTTGIFPAVLDTGNINTPYSQVIQYYIVRDTTVVIGSAPINAIIDSITITGVKGMPAGLSYACHNSNCTSAGAQTGCVTLSGTPTESGIFPITVYIRIKARAFLGPVPVGQTVNDSNSRYFIAIKPITNSIAQSAINNALFAYVNQIGVNVYLDAKDHAITHCQLIDVTGKTVADADKFVSNNYGVYVLDKHLLNSGIYFVKAFTKNGVAIKKVFID